MDGLSVVICCHNGGSRLPKVLDHLKVQKAVKAPWEVLVVDNASTDETTAIASLNWRNGPAPLRVIKEPTLGVRYARERGLAEAQYPFLGFVDDDNWVASDWVRTAHQIISSDSSLGAVGSIRTPAYEVSPPVWFEQVHAAYAILTDHEFERMPKPLPYLPTAGLCLRRVAWEKLIQNGFRFFSPTARQLKIVGGEDAELTRSLQLSGWKLRVDQRLRLQHFMPRHRLQWRYTRRLLRDYGASDALLDAYSDRSVSQEPGLRRWVSERWWYQLTSSLGRIARRPTVVLAALLSNEEGRNDIMELERQFGRALGLLRYNRRYSDLRREVRSASWRKTLNPSRLQDQLENEG
jgi:glycosyltransferase involved in cell wall biosynthesis